MRLVLALVLLAGCSKAFDDYAKKAKASEAEVNLDKLGKRVKEYVIMNGVLPTLSIPLTPASPCCAAGPQAQNKCPASPSAWEAWKDLDFVIAEPHHFQYSVESDGKKLSAKAVGDFDCDYQMIEYVLVGTMREGNLDLELTKPEPNTD